MNMRSNLLKSGIEIPVFSDMEALKLYFWPCKTGLETAIRVALELSFLSDKYLNSKSALCGGNSLLFHGLENRSLIVFGNEVELVDATDALVCEDKGPSLDPPLAPLSAEPHSQSCRTATHSAALNHLALQLRHVP